MAQLCDVRPRVCAGLTTLSCTRSVTGSWGAATNLAACIHSATSPALHTAFLPPRYDAIVALDESVRRRIVEMGVEENPQESNW